VLPVVSPDNKITGMISYKDILSAYREGGDEHEKKQPHISLKRRSMKMLIKGQKLITFKKD
jgi:chloride channel protein, CIC family